MQVTETNADGLKHEFKIVIPAGDLETRDRFPLRLYAGYDNSGNVATGRDRWNLGFNSGNALWLDGVLSYRFTSSDDFWHHRQPLRQRAHTGFAHDPRRDRAPIGFP